MPKKVFQTYFESQKDIHPSKIRMMDQVSVSALGFGTYLGDFNDETDHRYQENLLIAHQKGINHLDTAINYRCQRSERLIGQLFDEGKIDRDQVFLASKVGFIPFDLHPVEDAFSYIRDHWIKPGYLQDEDIVGHCHSMHPNFLKRALGMSLDNLKVKTLDLYYLHNPEVEKSHYGSDVFFEKLHLAFEFLEEQVSMGKIRAYGMATWTGFREEPHALDYLDLDKILKIAIKVGGQNHHFKAIQLPYNLAMLEAVSIPNQKVDGSFYPVIAAASMQGLNVVISAPLLQNQLASLPESLIGRIPGDLTPAQNALQFVMSTPGVSSALVGQKTRKHLFENRDVLTHENWDLAMLRKLGEFLINS